MHSNVVRNKHGEIEFAVASVSDITERKQAEEKLKQEQILLRTIVDSIPDAIYVKDTECRKMLANMADCINTGVNKEEDVIGKTDFDIYPAEIAEKFFNDDQRVMKQGVSVFDKEEELIQPNGHKKWLLTTKLPLNNDKGEIIGIVGIGRNITERKRAEKIQQLQYNIARATISTRNLNELFNSVKNELNSILDAKNFVIALYNEETGMLSANVEKDEKDEIPVWHAEKSLTGYVIRQNRPVLLRKNEILQLHEGGIIELIGTTAEAWLGVPLKVEDKMLGVVVVQNFDNPDVYDQTSIEIMQLVAHELSVFIEWQHSEVNANKLSRAIEQSWVSVAITNKEGIIEYTNPFFTKLTGYSFNEVKGKNFRILKSGHHSTTFYKDLWDTILSGNEWEGEILNKNKNGELYWANAIISPIVNNDGVITNFISIKEDITERKKMVENLITLKEKAEESDHLKSAFLANMSHEIRTPMNGILGFTELLLEPELSSEEKANYIEVVHQSGQRMLNTLNDIIEFSKIEAGMIQLIEKETDINQRLVELTRFFQPEAEKKGLTLSLDKLQSLEIKSILTDQNKLDSILTNLIKNAIKYTDSGIIKVGYVIKKDTEPAEVEFYVKDSGIGIPTNRQEAVFNRFEQADINDTRAFQGSGLGLAIAKSFVEMLGGKIWLESREGKGSTFYFTLPAKNDFSEKPIVQLKKSPDYKSAKVSKLKILIAEDDDASFMFLEASIKRYNFEIARCVTGSETVKYCQSNRDIDIILMDIKMPKMDGYEATRRIREFNKEVVIIAQTAFAISGDRLKAIEAGCNDYISKPINKTKLHALIKKYFGK